LRRFFVLLLSYGSATITEINGKSMGLPVGKKGRV